MTHEWIHDSIALDPPVIAVMGCVQVEIHAPGEDRIIAISICFHVQVPESKDEQNTRQNGSEAGTLVTAR
jgi:hypothetical protein